MGEGGNTDIRSFLRRWGHSGRDARPALGAATGQDAAAAAGSHPEPEPVRLLPVPVVGLIRSLRHGASSSSMGLGRSGPEGRSARSHTRLSIAGQSDRVGGACPGWHGSIWARSRPYRRSVAGFGRSELRSRKTKKVVKTRVLSWNRGQGRSYNPRHLEGSSPAPLPPWDGPPISTLVESVCG